jgi:hypothetical protein
MNRGVDLCEDFVKNAFTDDGEEDCVPVKISFEKEVDAPICCGIMQSRAVILWVNGKEVGK